MVNLEDLKEELLKSGFKNTGDSNEIKIYTFSNSRVLIHYSDFNKIIQNLSIELLKDNKPTNVKNIPVNTGIYEMIETINSYVKENYSINFEEFYDEYSAI